MSEWENPVKSSGGFYWILRGNSSPLCVIHKLTCVSAMLENPVEITENPWNYRTFNNPLKSNVLLELSNDWNYMEFTGTNILRAMVQTRSKISQNGQKSISNIEFGVTFDKNWSGNPLSMVLIDFDDDLIDYTNFYQIQNREFSRKFPGNREFSRKFPGNFPKVYLELFEIIGI